MASTSPQELYRVADVMFSFSIILQMPVLLVYDGGFFSLADLGWTARVWLHDLFVTYPCLYVPLGHCGSVPSMTPAMWVSLVLLLAGLAFDHTGRKRSREAR